MFKNEKSIKWLTVSLSFKRNAITIIEGKVISNEKINIIVARCMNQCPLVTFSYFLLNNNNN